MATKKTKKKPKGVLVRIGEMATMAAEAVIDTGSKAVHAVGSMMPSGTSEKSAKAPSSAPKPKTAKTTATRASKPKTAKLAARTAKVAPKGAKKTAKTQKKVAAQSIAPQPKTEKSATKKSTVMNSAKSTGKAAHASKPKRSAGKKR
jgi:hypothetical protein